MKPRANPDKNLNRTKDLNSNETKNPNLNRTTNARSDQTALNAVAFQDHLVRSLNLDLNPPRFTTSKVQSTKAKLPQRSPVKKSSPSNQKNRKAEFVLDAKKIKPTLAQRMGLVALDVHNLSEEDWSQTKALSNARDDSSEPCPICRELFLPGRQQVLLSCSHVFHRACIRSYEQFSGQKRCPMCRKKEYQTRVIYEGEDKTRQKMATKIQAAWKMYVVRKWYLEFQKLNPPKDPKLRRKHFERRLVEISDRLVTMTREMATGVDDLMKEVDTSIRNSRKLMKQIDQTPLSDEQWTLIESRAIEMTDDGDCAICLMPTHQGSSRIVLLSCAHTLHQNCLESYESFAEDECEYLCPLCRCAYHKRVM